MDSYYSIAFNVIFTQINVEKEIKLFGERSVAIMFKKYKQLDQGRIPSKPVFE